MENAFAPQSSAAKSKEVVRDIVRGSCGLIAGAVFAFALYLLCAFSAGAGHGSYTPFLLFVTDRLYGLVLFLFLGSFIALRRHKWAVVAIACVLVLSLGGVVLQYARVAGELRREADLSQANVMTALAVLAYLAAQVSGWAVVIKRVLDL